MDWLCNKALRRVSLPPVWLLQMTDVTSAKIDIFPTSPKGSYIVFRTDEWRDIETRHPLPHRQTQPGTPSSCFGRAASLHFNTLVHSGTNSLESLRTRLFERWPRSRTMTYIVVVSDLAESKPSISHVHVTRQKPVVCGTPGCGW